ncbi:glycosyltransferase family 4 protein [Halogranum rubrum]|uniref:glycosyltransferase family 4 protein n=1 Tax=Halogranum rubrum TaxID=553466 RepID=UPI000A05CC05|nr:glycosyltransferase family 4 protein [Halogranum salarium]
MVRVLTFLNEVSSTSIPFEIAVEIHNETPITVDVVSFYDDQSTVSDIIEGNLRIEALDANSRFDRRAYRRLREIALEGDYDAIHTHQNFTGSVARAVVADTDLSIVDTEHNDHRHFSVLQNVTNSVTFPFADQIVSNSESTRDSFRWYERLLSLNSEVSTIYNGVNLGRIQSAEERELIPDLPDGPLIVTVGVMTQQKDQETLLRTIIRVNQDYPEATLVIVGDGPLKRELQTKVDDLNIDCSVLFTGFLPKREDVYAVLHASDIFTISSTYEGFCVAAVEAMACSLPLVVSDIDVLHEVVGDAGQFATPRNPSSFANQITELLSNPPRATRLGRRARERVEERFPLGRTAEKYATLYSELSQ